MHYKVAFKSMNKLVITTNLIPVVLKGTYLWLSFIESGLIFYQANVNNVAVQNCHKYQTTETTLAPYATKQGATDA